MMNILKSNFWDVRMRDQDLASAIVFAFFVMGFVVMLFYFHIKQQKLLCFKNREEDDGRIEYSLL